MRITPSGQIHMQSFRCLCKVSSSTCQWGYSLDAVEAKPRWDSEMIRPAGGRDLCV